MLKLKLKLKFKDGVEDERWSGSWNSNKIKLCHIPAQAGLDLVMPSFILFEVELWNLNFEIVSNKERVREREGEREIERERQ